LTKSQSICGNPLPMDFATLRALLRPHVTGLSNIATHNPVMWEALGLPATEIEVRTALGGHSFDLRYGGRGSKNRSSALLLEQWKR